MTDQSFVNDLAAQQAKTREEIKQYRQWLRLASRSESDSIQAKLIMLDEKDQRLQRLLDLAEHEGVVPVAEENRQSDLARRIFGGQKDSNSTPNNNIGSQRQ